jgi:hypothetical protein
MTKITYEIVEHDGGWAYRVDGVFSETFSSHDIARRAAERANEGTSRTGKNDGHHVRGQRWSLAQRALARRRSTRDRRRGLREDSAIPDTHLTREIE